MIWKPLAIGVLSVATGMVWYWVNGLDTRVNAAEEKAAALEVSLVAKAAALEVRLAVIDTHYQEIIRRLDRIENLVQPERRSPVRPPGPGSKGFGDELTR